LHPVLADLAAADTEAPTDTLGYSTESKLNMVRSRIFAQMLQAL
jgi:hypothetical protein